MIALADLPGVRFVRLEPKGAVIDDVLTGILGVIHANASAAPNVIHTFLAVSETNFTLVVVPLGIGHPQAFEITFATPGL